MSSSAFRFFTTLRQFLIYFLFNLLLCLPLLPVLAYQLQKSPVQAAANSLWDNLGPPASKADLQQRCAAQNPADSLGNAISQIDPSLSPADHDLAVQEIQKEYTDPNFGLEYIPAGNIANLPLKDAITTELNQQGFVEGQGWWVCQATAPDIAGYLPFTQKAQEYFNTLENDAAKISFSNPEDFYALTGEPCRKFNGEVCDESTHKVPAIDPGTGQPERDANGKPVMQDVPLYYDDVGWVNGHWDAPKADIRILKTLLYLVTPTADGGAGHEYIGVGRILQDSKTDPEFSATSPAPIASSTSSATSSPSDTPSPTAATPPPEDPSSLAAHTYDDTNPENPSKIAQAVDIKYIDKLRVTTKTIERKHGAEWLGLGHDDVNFDFSSFPIQVAWQTTAGLASSPPPNPTDFYTGSADAFDSGIGSMLNELGISPNSFPTHNLGITGFGDISRKIGQTLLGQILGVPADSLSGANLDQGLIKLGKAYIAKNFKIDPKALAGGNFSAAISKTSANSGSNSGRSLADQTSSTGSDLSLQSIATAAGEAQIEQELGLPSGSLAGNTSANIWQSVGQRYLEDTIFQVTPGTLSGSIASQSDFLSRLGAGRIEQVFSLPDGSLQRANSLNDLLNSSPNARASFTLADQGSGGIDEDLGLAYDSDRQGSSSLFGFSAADLATPTADLLSNKIDFQKYKQIVGSKVVENSLGQYSEAPPDDLTGGEETSPYGVIESRFTADSNFITYLFNSVFGQRAPDPSANNVNSIVTGQSNAQLLLKYQAFNQAQLTDLITQVETAQQSCQFIVVECHGGMLSATWTQNFVPLHNAIATYWRPTIATALQNVNNLIAADNSKDDPTAPSTLSQADATIVNASSVSGMINTMADPSTVVDVNKDEPTIYTIQKLLQQTSALINSYDDGLAQLESLQGGQSGRSAALGLPGALPAVDASGNQTTGFVYQQDLGNQIVAGSITPTLLQNLGRLIISKQVTTSSMGQLLLAAALSNSSSDGSYDLFASTSVSSADLLTKGLSESDFNKIFNLNLGQAVFLRTGALQLINQEPGQPSNNQTSTSSSTDSQINPNLLNASTDVSFYRDRFTAALALLNSLSSKTDSLKTALQNYYTNGQLNDLSQTLIPAFQESANQLEALLPPILSCSASNCQADVDKANQAAQDFEEIIAGQSLDLSSSSLESLTPAQADTTVSSYNFSSVAYAAGPNFTSIGQGCISGEGNLIGSLQSAPASLRQTIIDNAAKQTGSCIVESSFNLPSRSLSLFSSLAAASGGYSLDNLETAVGLANRNLNGLNGQDPAAVKREGATIITNRSIPALVAAVPGFSTTASQYKLSPKDIFSVITGNLNPVAEKIGGFMLDHHFNWPANTTYTLINPCDKISHPDQKTACDPDKVRANKMAVLGLNELAQNLGFPSGFDAGAGGSIFQNFAASYLAQILNLPVSSIKGTFQSMRQTLPANSLLAPFGLSPTPHQNQMNTLKTAVQNINTTNNALASEVNQLLDQAEKDSYNELLDDVSDHNSAFWQPSSPQTANQLAQKYLSSFTRSLNRIKGVIQQKYPAVDAKPFTSQIDAAISAANSGFQPAEQALSNLIASFQSRVISIEQQLNVGKTGNIAITQAAAGFIGSLLSNHGKTDITALGNTLARNLLTNPTNGLLTEGFIRNKFKDNPYVLSVLNLFDSAAQQQAGSNCQGIAIQLQDVIGGKNVKTPNNPFGNGSKTCQIPSLGDLDFNNIVNNPTARGLLYDNLLGRTFSTKVESDMDLPPGTIKALIVDPKHAKLISASAGMKMLAEALNPNPSSTDPLAQTQTALVNAFLKGFYNVDRNSGNVSFNLNRGVNALGGELSTIALNQFDRQKVKVEGVTITGADLFAALSGNITTFASSALQQYISNLNQGIVHPPSGAPDYRAARFTINYADVRSSLGLPVSRQELDAAGQAAQTAYVKSKLSASDPCKSAVGSNLVQCYQKGHPDDSLNLKNAYKKGQSSFHTQSRQDALNSLRYEALDLIAFEADHNIPPGFSRAMLEGNTGDRIRMLGAFLFNSVGGDQIAKQIFGNTPQAKAFERDLVVFVQQGFKDSTQPGGVTADGLLTELQNGGETYVANWLANNFQKSTGIKLPQGFMTALVKWGVSGFDSDSLGGAFANVKIDNIPLGSTSAQLKTALEGQAFAWAGKQLHIPSAQLQDIYSKGQALVKNIQGYINGTVSGRKLGASAAAFATTIGEIVFSKDIAQFEQSLGLPHGTISGLISMAIDLAQQNYIQAAVDLAFVVYNVLFGVFRTDHIITATADGYYPQRPTYLSDNSILLTPGNTIDEAVNCDQVAPQQNNWENGKQTCLKFHPPHDEYVSPSLITGEFDAGQQASYRNGLLQAAQGKVYSTLVDLSLIADLCPTALCGQPQDIWIPQVFTGRVEDLDAINNLVSRPAPWDNPSGWGYGPLSERASSSGSGSNQTLTAQPNYRSGFFAAPAFADHIHIRW